MHVYTVVLIGLLVHWSVRIRVIVVLCVVLFFFQAEDGIRDLVRSRGLGDVYKRQVQRRPQPLDVGEALDFDADADRIRQDIELLDPDPVSYTHLTLPTSDLV